jgi:hypothetical protein
MCATIGSTSHLSESIQLFHATALKFGFGIEFLAPRIATDRIATDRIAAFGICACGISTDGMTAVALSTFRSVQFMKQVYGHF